MRVEGRSCLDSGTWSRGHGASVLATLASKLEGPNAYGSRTSAKLSPTIITLLPYLANSFSLYWPCELHFHQQIPYYLPGLPVALELSLVSFSRIFNMPDREYGSTDYQDEDDKKLEAMGYVPSFKREFSNLATVCAFPPFFGRVSYGRRLFRSALPSALWCVLVAFLRPCPLKSAQRVCAHPSRPH
jgi:hypothetical protein